MALDRSKELSDHAAGFDYFYSRVKEKNELLPKEFPFLEIGTRQGGSALLFLEAIKGKDRLFITVDPYGKDYKSGGQWPLIGEPTYRLAMKEIFAMACAYDITHVHYRMTSRDFIIRNPLCCLWQDNKTKIHNFGVVYLDGEHEEDTILTEISFLMNRINDNGLLIIDDISYIQNTKDPFLCKLMKVGKIDCNRLFVEMNELRKGKECCEQKST